MSFSAPANPSRFNPPRERRTELPTTASRVDAISLVIIPSTDRDRSIAFYTEKLRRREAHGHPIGRPVPLGRGLPAERHDGHRVETMLSTYTHALGQSFDRVRGVIG